MCKGLCIKNKCSMVLIEEICALLYDNISLKLSSSDVIRSMILIMIAPSDARFK